VNKKRPFCGFNGKALEEMRGTRKEYIYKKGILKKYLFSKFLFKNKYFFIFY